MDLLAVALYIGKIFCDGDDESKQRYKGSDESNGRAAGQFEFKCLRGFQLMNTLYTVESIQSYRITQSWITK